ncbi:hypothetical protein KUV50_08675 [Membranicola marinus]|uniref:Uncharacterized protein n=1 Tax=Membranihabitans marinus TaxID=1227546 RepID=A0A953HX35_9BACT|nr:hypothetical protein [Membranihabitans marinus]MBY5958201.1 hypothetical protein [Membranihabitans marinus]
MNTVISILNYTDEGYVLVKLLQGNHMWQENKSIKGTSFCVVRSTFESDVPLLDPG